MSMLAEPKRKKKWSLNPRGKIWSNDDSKLGQKLLEKMGWSKGKGLGRDEQGDLEPVRLKYKNDAEGVGYIAKDDQWIAHHEEFNAILGKLNGTETPAPVPETVPVKSLEVRSKVSKARVHYHKFTRGKDLSRYSESDLASILGKRTTSSNPNSDEEKATEQGAGVEQEVVGEVGIKQETSESSCDTEHLHGVTTINKGNIHEYFAAKMATLKAKSQGLAPQLAKTTLEPESQEASNAEKRVRINEELNQVKEFCSKKKITEWSQETLNSAELVDIQVEVKKEKSKKKKRKEKLLELGEAVILDFTEGVEQERQTSKSKKRKLKQEVVSEVNPDAEQATPKKKKKKDKGNQENYPPVNTVSEEGEPLNDEKKKSKRKKDKSDETAELTLQTEPAEPSETDEPPKKKKKKSKNEADASSTIAANQSVPDHIEVMIETHLKKRNKKSQLEDEESCTVTSSDEVTLTLDGVAENQEADGLKKKKKKKNKNINEDRTQDTNAATKQSDPLAETTDLPGAVGSAQQECNWKTSNADSSNTAGGRNNYSAPDFSFLDNPSKVKQSVRKYEMVSFDMFKGSNLFTLAGYGNSC